MWQNAKVLQSEMTGSGDTSASKQLRVTFLEAVISLQTTLCIQDFGQLHFEPVIHPSTGSVILVSIRSVPDVNLVGATRHVKWTSLTRCTGYPLDQQKLSRNESVEPEGTYHKIHSIIVRYIFFYFLYIFMIII